MNINKIGKFIKELRENKKWSQEELATKLYCDRTVINKIENGKRTIKIEELTLLSEIFDISIEELITGEKKNIKSNKIIKTNFNNYLININKKIKIMYIIIGILLICFLTIIFLYFLNNYNSIKVYRLSGSSSNYEINEGLLLISKDKIYFKIDNIDPKVDSIEIYSEINNKKKLIYKGDPNVVLNDYYGYESYISYDDFIKNKQIIYVTINGEEIKLNFKEDFTNNKLFYKKEIKISDEDNESQLINIPNKIKDNFECDSTTCHLDLKDENLIYNSNSLTVMKNNKYYFYDITTKTFNYQDLNNPDLNFIITIKDNEPNCNTDNCKNIYNEFYNNYILKYIY